MLSLILWLLFPNPSLGDFDNFPVKSVNLGAAADVAFFTNPFDGSQGQLGIFDAHPVHGIQAQNSAEPGWVLVGKALESESAPTMEAFAIKLDSLGNFVWGWRSNVAGDDAANAVAELSNGDLVVVGFKKDGSAYKRCITLLNGANGSEKWTTTNFGDSQNSNGAWENVEIDTGRNALLLSGFKSKSTTDEYFFKSYGNTPGGRATVIAIPTADLKSTVGISDATWTWTSGSAQDFTVKATAVIPGAGKIAALIWGEEADSANVVVLDATSGTVQWGPLKYGQFQGEGTDMTASLDGETLAVTGHGPPSSGTGGYAGKLTLINANTGARISTSEFESTPGSPTIFNECWGVKPVLGSTDFVLACGTGLEDCSALSGSEKTACTNDQPVNLDPRPGSVARSSGVWQTLVIRTDSEGALLWQRVDQYRLAGEPALGEAGWEQHSSAAEYVFVGADGSIGIISDEWTGAGLLLLSSQGTVQPSSSPAPGASPSNSPAAAASPAAGYDNNLVIGDSFAAVEYLGTLTADLCAGKGAKVEGIGGSTASEWAANLDNMMSEAFSVAGGPFPVAWLSVGGNDWLETGCTIDTSVVVSNVKSAIAQAFSQGPDGLRLMMTGYCVPSDMDLGGGCTSVQNGFTPLQDAIRTAVEEWNDNPANAGKSVSFFDIRYFCGGTATEPSSAEFFVDPIHLSPKGYCQVLTHPPIQEFLGCAPYSYDCEAGAPWDPQPAEPSPSSSPAPSSSRSPAPSSSSSPALQATPSSSPEAPGASPSSSPEGPGASPSSSPEGPGASPSSSPEAPGASPSSSPQSPTVPCGSLNSCGECLASWQIVEGQEVALSDCMWCEESGECIDSAGVEFLTVDLEAALAVYNQVCGSSFVPLDIGEDDELADEAIYCALSAREPTSSAPSLSKPSILIAVLTLISSYALASKQDS